MLVVINQHCGRRLLQQLTGCPILLPFTSCSPPPASPHHTDSSSSLAAESAANTAVKLEGIMKNLERLALEKVQQGDEEGARMILQVGVDGCIKPMHVTWMEDVFFRLVRRWRILRPGGYMDGGYVFRVGTVHGWLPYGWGVCTACSRVGGRRVAVSKRAKGGVPGVSGRREFCRRFCFLFPCFPLKGIV